MENQNIYNKLRKPNLDDGAKIIQGSLLRAKDSLNLKRQQPIQGIESLSICQSGDQVYLAGSNRLPAQIIFSEKGNTFIKQLTVPERNTLRKILRGEELRQNQAYEFVELFNWGTESIIYQFINHPEYVIKQAFQAFNQDQRFYFFTPQTDQMKLMSYAAAQDFFTTHPFQINSPIIATSNISISRFVSIQNNPIVDWLQRNKYFQVFQEIQSEFSAKDLNIMNYTKCSLAKLMGIYSIAIHELDAWALKVIYQHSNSLARQLELKSNILENESDEMLANLFLVKDCFVEFWEALVKSGLELEQFLETPNGNRLFYQTMVILEFGVGSNLTSSTPEL